MSVNLFFCRTESEAITCCQIMNSLPAGERSFVYAKKRPAYELSKALSAAEVRFVDDEGEYATRFLSSKKLAKLVAADVGSPQDVRLFTVEYGASACAAIGALQRLGCRLHVSLYPHGRSLSSYRRFSPGERLMLRLKSWSRMPFGEFRYCGMRDRRGYSAPLTEAVYVLPGQEDIVKAYHHRVLLVPVSPLPLAHAGRCNRALVVGQSTIGDRYLTPDTEGEIVSAMARLAAEMGLEGIDYLPHPRRTKHQCLKGPGFEMVQTSFSAEVLIATKGYPLVMSFSSSALIYARMLLGSSDVRIASIGINLVSQDRKLDEVLRLYREVGVEIVSA